MFHLRNSKGVTLIEIMIVVVIVGIIAATATPDLGRAISRAKFKSQVKSALSMLRLARSNAISQKVPHGVHFDVNSNTCILFEDLANPETFTYDAGSDPIIKVDTLTGQYKYLWSSFITSGIVFQPNGTASETGYIFLGSYDDESASHSGMSVLASTGKARMDYIENY